MKTQHPHARRRRAKGALAILLGLVGLLVLTFFRVQVLSSSTYKLQAESNRLRPLDIPAPRGTIFDRNGRVIADNVPGYAVTILPAPRDSMIATLDRLRPYLDFDDQSRTRLLRTMDRYRNQALVVDQDVPFEAVSALEEQKARFPNVYVEMRPKRRYLAGPALSHVLGSIGEITAAELQAPFYAESGLEYEQGMIVGKTGIEREYEHVLQGVQGTRFVEVDARGRIVGDFAGSTSRPGEAGGNLTLNIDMELQQWIHRIFPEGKTGAVVALDPSDGGVLALYSAPVYDPNAFVGGIDPELWGFLNTDESKPLYNRAVQGAFPPASTWKLATAAIGLDEGVITPEERMPIPCTGGMTFGNRYYRCWNRSGHGFVDLAGAITHSCDVYFYQLGIRLGLERLLERSTQIGFGKRCGIDLPEESAGSFPADKSYWERNWGYTPLEGEVLSLAIGQGPNSQTPLKMAQFYVALARDGTAPAPKLFKGAPHEEGWELNLSHEHLEALRAGLRGVTSPGGTAHYRAFLEHWDIVGKTGTGQNSLSIQGLADDHAWFAGMAGPRGGDPEIVVVAIVEYGGGGSTTASPIVAKTADFYLRKKYGMPIDTVQTLAEHVMAGRPWPEWANR